MDFFIYNSELSKLKLIDDFYDLFPLQKNIMNAINIIRQIFTRFTILVIDDHLSRVIGSSYILHPFQTCQGHLLLSGRRRT